MAEWLQKFLIHRLLWLGCCGWMVAAPAWAGDTPGLCRLTPAMQAPLLTDCTTALPPSADGRRHELLRLEVSEPLNPILWLGVPDALSAEVWLHRPDHSTQQLLALDPDDGFAQRPVADPQLRLPLRLEAGLHTLELRYRLHGNGRLPVQLLDAHSSARHRLLTDVFNGLLLGLLLTVLTGVLLYNTVVRQRAYLAYGALLCSHMLWLVQVEGYGFMLLWPHAAHWNQIAPTQLSVLVVSCHAVFVLFFFQLKRRFVRLYHGHLLLLGLLLGCALPLGSSEQQVAFTLAVGMAYAVLALATGLQATRQRLPGARLYLMGTGAMLLSGYVLFPMGVMGHNPLPGVSFFLYPKIGMLLETLFFAAALRHRLHQFRTQHAEQRQRRLADAQALLQAEQARRSALARADHKSLQLATASHDIAQPLASLRLALEALHTAPSATPALAQHLDRTLAQAQTLLRELMQRERQEHQRSAQPPVVLGELIDEVVRELRPIAQAKGLRLDGFDSLAEVPASGLILGRVLRNLVGNALRYTEHGRVLVGVRLRPGGLELQVHDTGPGLWPDQLALLQQPFQQGPGAHPEGQGLGLFIVRSLCSQCGWTLRVRSQPGRGSCFAVYLPHA